MTYPATAVAAQSSNVTRTEAIRVLIEHNLPRVGSSCSPEQYRTMGAASPRGSTPGLAKGWQCSVDAVGDAPLA